MPESHFSDVRGLGLFATMAEDSFVALMRGSFVQNFPPHVDLITEGEPSDFLHVVLSGSVELFSRWNGRETCLFTMRPVSTLILAASIIDAVFLMSARTLEKSRIALIPSQNVRDVFETDATFAREIVRELSLRFRSSVRTTKNLKLRNSTERLANYLLSLEAKNTGESGLVLPTEKRLLASFLGMTPENLSRAFKALRRHGVECSGADIEIRNRAALERYARPCPLIDDQFA